MKGRIGSVGAGLGVACAASVAVLLGLPAQPAQRLVQPPLALDALRHRGFPPA